MTIHCSFESPIFGVRVQLESQIVHNMWMRPSITELFVLLAESKLPTNSFSGPLGDWPKPASAADPCSFFENRLLFS